MKELTREEKLDLIFQQVEKHHITAYEIGENTELNTSGVHRIFSKEITNPRHKTLDIILTYIEDKITGKHIPGHKNYTTPSFPHILAEEAEKYSEDVQRVISMLRDIQKTIRTDHDAMAAGITKIYLNTEELIDGSAVVSDSITALITTINNSPKRDS